MKLGVAEAPDPTIEIQPAITYGQFFRYLPFKTGQTDEGNFFSPCCPIFEFCGILLKHFEYNIILTEAPPSRNVLNRGETPTHKASSAFVRL